MNYDTSRWLKDELGLTHMSEADLNSLIFHPRHGSLCRRFVNFLAESTLCKNKYPNVYAKEEYMSATKELEQKKSLLISSVKELEHIARESENDMRELEFLKSRLSQLKAVQQLLKGYSESLKSISNRPTFLLEELSKSLDNPEYLTNTSLASMYDVEIPDLKNSPIITDREISTIDARLKELIGDIESMQLSSTDLVQSIIPKMNNLNLADIGMSKIKDDELEALKVPQIEEEEIDDLEPEEKSMRDLNSDLTRRVSELDQQVVILADQYSRRKINIKAAATRDLDECLRVLDFCSTVSNLAEDSKKLRAAK